MPPSSCHRPQLHPCPSPLPPCSPIPVLQARCGTWDRGTQAAISTAPLLLTSLQRCCPSTPSPRVMPKGTGHGTVLPTWPHKVPLASRRGGTEHPHQAPYLAVVRPTVMGTIENPKIDRWNRLEAVSLTVRAAWGKSGVRRWGQFAAGPSSPTVHPSPFLHQLHAAGGYGGACRVS